MINNKEYFVSGIDTDCGKTYITGLLAYQLKQLKYNIITSKFVQTGCIGISEDILAHRKAMAIEPLAEDKEGLTCPFVYTFPASAHLSAEIDKKPFDADVVRQSTNKLIDKYNIVLTEGAGGLCVPISQNILTTEYIKTHQIPLILVSSSKLGSINHTLLSISYCVSQQIDLKSIIYNKMPQDDSTIAQDTFKYLQYFLQKNHPNINLIHSDKLCANKTLSETDIKQIFAL